MRISDWSSDVCSSELPSEALYCAHVHRIDEGRYRSRSRCSARPERAADRTQGSALQGRGAVGQMVVDGRDRKSVVEGKSVSVRVDLGGRRIIKKKRKSNKYRYRQNRQITVIQVVRNSYSR